MKSNLMKISINLGIRDEWLVYRKGNKYVSMNGEFISDDKIERIAKSWSKVMNAIEKLYLNKGIAQILNSNND